MARSGRGKKAPRRRSVGTSPTSVQVQNPSLKALHPSGTQLHILDRWYGYSLKEGLGFDLGEPKRRNKLVGEGVKFLANLGKPVARGSIKLEVAIRKWRTR